MTTARRAILAAIASLTLCAVILGSVMTGEAINWRRYILGKYDPAIVQYAALSGASTDAATLATLSGYARTIRAGGTVTLSSLTAKFSLLDAYAFVTQCSTDLRWLSFLGAKTTWSDGSNTAVGYASSTVASGETLGAEFITGLTNIGYETFTANANGKDIDQAVNSSGSALAITNGTTTTGALFKVTTNCTVASGSGPRLEAVNLDNNTVAINAAAMSGARIDYRTTADIFGRAQKGFGLYNASGINGDWSVVWSAKPVLTPYLGLWLLKTAGGAAGWASTGTFNPDAAAFNLTLGG